MLEIIKTWVHPWWGIAPVAQDTKKWKVLVLWLLPMVTMLIGVGVVFSWAVESIEEYGRAAFVGMLMVASIGVFIVFSIVGNLIIGYITFLLWKKFYKEIPPESNFMQIISGQAKQNWLFLLLSIIDMILLVISELLTDGIGLVVLGAMIFMLIFLSWSIAIIFGMAINVGIEKTHRPIAVIIYIVLYFILTQLMSSIGPILIALRMHE